MRAPFSEHDGRNEEDWSRDGKDGRKTRRQAVDGCWLVVAKE